MEARWAGCGMRLDAEALHLEQPGVPPVAVPLDALEGFTVLPTGSAPPSGRAASWTPDGELLVAWREETGARREARLPVPSQALQVQLFLARLAQVRPGADLRGLTPGEALSRLELPARPAAPHRSSRALAMLLVVGVLGALAAVWVLAR